jgi:hypothetical protein
MVYVRSRMSVIIERGLKASVEVYRSLDNRALIESSPGLTVSAQFNVGDRARVKPVRPTSSSRQYERDPVDMCTCLLSKNILENGSMSEMTKT